MIPSFGTSITPGSSRAGLLLSAMPNPSPFYPRNELWTSLIYLVSSQEPTDTVQLPTHCLVLPYLPQTQDKLGCVKKLLPLEAFPRTGRRPTNKARGHGGSSPSVQLSDLSSQLPCKEELLLASTPALPCQQLHCPRELAQS